MIIRVILLAAIVLIFLWFLSHAATTRGQAWGKVCALLLMIFAIFAVLFPDLTNNLAHLVGVGRGADLLLYGLTVAFLATLLVNYLYHQEEQRKTIRLARHIAIMEASRDPRNTFLIKNSQRSN